MRKTNIYHSIKISKKIYNRILKDKKHFQKTISGGKWSISDTINEWLKMIDNKR